MKIFKKMITLLLSIVFTLEQAAFAQEINYLWHDIKITPSYKGIGPVNIPYEFGMTEAVVGQGGGDENIINIQDAHASLSGQYSIVNLLDSLIKNYDLSFVGIEGSSGFVDTSILKTFPNKKIMKETGDFLMREGKMSAGEFLAVTNEKNNVLLYGAENEKLYQENLESFRAIAEKSAGVLNDIEELSKDLFILSSKVMGKDAREFMMSVIAHKKGNKKFEDYWEALGRFIKEYKININKYSELTGLTRVVAFEKEIDFAKANQERQKLIGVLKEKLDRKKLEILVLRSVELKQKKISDGAYHSYLAGVADAANIPEDGYKELIKFIKYITMYEKLNLTGLYKEIELLEKELREKIYLNEDERALYRLIEFTGLLDKLYKIELNNDERMVLESFIAEDSVEKIQNFLTRTSDKYKADILREYDIAGIISGVTPALKFYKLAEERDKSILENTLKYMRKEGKRVGALITGGYHSKGLMSLMKDKNVSYMVVVPKFDSKDTRPYAAILTNKKKEYEKIMETTRYKLAVSSYLYSAEGDINKLKTAIFYALSRSVLEKENLEKIKNIWAGQYRAEYDALSVSRKEEIKHDRVTPENFEEFLKRIDIREIKGNAVIIEKDAQGILYYLTLVKENGETFTFNLASKEEREVYLKRTGMAKLQEELKNLGALDIIKEIETDVLYRASNYMFQQHLEFFDKLVSISGKIKEKIRAEYDLAVKDGRIKKDDLDLSEFYFILRNVGAIPVEQIQEIYARDKQYYKKYQKNIIYGELKDSDTRMFNMLEDLIDKNNEALKIIGKDVLTRDDAFKAMEYVKKMAEIYSDFDMSDNHPGKRIFEINSILATNKGMTLTQEEISLLRSITGNLTSLQDVIIYLHQESIRKVFNKIIPGFGEVAGSNVDPVKQLNLPKGSSSFYVVEQDKALYQFFKIGFHTARMVIDTHAPIAGGYLLFEYNEPDTGELEDIKGGEIRQKK
ncbi:conserved hypothetical protein, secreted [Candidatus Omnitrophus magneticus]|uniref:Secreted protein n=1 Tax=Candidatus Omnitrophus magneticus TaxID=1609969 RepID=A0A0F0CPR6_9BACT|nr:conserved hypothetical protein, secreted [Candidatus Omnitrophus magneticus]